MIFNINSTRGHTGSLLVYYIGPNSLYDDSIVVKQNCQEIHHNDRYNWWTIGKWNI